MNVQLGQRKMDTLNNAWRTCLLLQSALHQIENIKDDVVFRHKNKVRLQNTIHWLDEVVNTLTKDFNIAESQDYIDNIESIDKFISEYELEFRIETNTNNK